MKLQNIYRLSLLLPVIFLMSGCSVQSYRIESKKKAKNVILIIGDGMGLSHLYGAMSVSTETMNLEKAKNIGFVKTHSFDNYVTESSGAATAMATGTKTRNGIVGMASDSTMLTNLTEILHSQNKASGVVATSAVTHATPACFVAHNISRNNYYEIAEDFLKCQPDVFIGGGKKYFSDRPDGVNLIEKLKSEGYDVVFNLEELLETNSTKLAALLADNHLPKISEGREDMLAYSAIKAIETLSKNTNGFFLMIEASQIDWAAHGHETKYLIEEVIDFDRTVGVVVDYANRLGETLVLVTADHETAGMTLVDGDVVNKSVKASYSVGGHTGIAVPIFSYGPAADSFTGFMDNTDIFKRIVQVMSLDKGKK